MSNVNDADIEMAEMAQDARTAAAGVCPICETPLDPFHPKWAKSYAGRKYTAQDDFDCYGPVHSRAPYHHSCLEGTT